MIKEFFMGTYHTIYDFIYSIWLFFKKYKTRSSTLIGIIASLLGSSFGNQYSLILYTFSSLLTILLIGFYIYYRIYIYVPVELIDKTYSMEFNNPPHNSYFKTPDLMLDEIFTTQLYLKLKINQTFKNNIKKEKKEGLQFYSLIIEKDKSITITMTPEYVNDEDLEYNGRNSEHYYLIQEYKNQKELEFYILFSCSNKININKECKIFLEYGDIHNNIENSKFRNKIFGKDFFITDLSSTIK